MAYFKRVYSIIGSRNEGTPYPSLLIHCEHYHQIIGPGAVNGRMCVKRTLKHFSRVREQEPLVTLHVSHLRNGNC